MSQSMEDFSEEQLKGIEMLFRQFDEDNSGRIDLDEFRLLAKKMGIEMNDDKLRQSIRSVAGASEELDLSQFVQWLRNCQTDGEDPFSMLKAKIKAQGVRPLSNAQIEVFRECFDTFDTDGSGSIDVQELGNVFQSFGQSLTDQEILQMINEVDADGSGEIEFPEFLLLMVSTFGQADCGEEVHAALKKFDHKKNGCVTRSDFETVMRELCGDTLTEEEIIQISAVAAEAASPYGRGNPTPDGLIQYMNWESLWEAVQDEM